jgi:hypothetical protein
MCQAANERTSAERADLVSEQALVAELATRV